MSRNMLTVTIYAISLALLPRLRALAGHGSTWERAGARTDASGTHAGLQCTLYSRLRMQDRSKAPRTSGSAAERGPSAGNRPVHATPPAEKSHQQAKLLEQSPHIAPTSSARLVRTGRNWLHPRCAPQETARQSDQCRHRSLSSIQGASQTFGSSQSVPGPCTCSARALADISAA